MNINFNLNTVFFPSQQIDIAFSNVFSLVVVVLFLTTTIYAARLTYDKEYG